MRIGLSSTLIAGAESGTGQYLLGLLRALLRHAPEHEVVVFALEPELPIFAFARGAARLVGVPAANRQPVRDFAWHQTALPRLAAELRLDVLHVPSHRRMVWGGPCAVVTTLPNPGVFRPARHGRVPVPSRAAVFRVLARRQDALIVTAASALDAVVRAAHVPAARVHVVPPGLDHDRFTPGQRDEATARIARRHGIRPPFFLHVSKLEGARNHARLIEAFNAFKTATPSPWQLVLAGADGRGAERVHQTVRRSPYAPDIFCPGFVPAEELPDWYRAAGALVYPPARAGFCLPVVEALACGCPVLASSSGSAPEITGGAALLTEPRDVAALRRQLTRLAFDPPLRAQLREAGLVRARAFDDQRMAAATLEIYAQVTRPAPVPVPTATPVPSAAE